MDEYGLSMGAQIDEAARAEAVAAATASLADIQEREAYGRATIRAEAAKEREAFERPFAAILNADAGATAAFDSLTKRLARTTEMAFTADHFRPGTSLAPLDIRLNQQTSVQGLPLDFEWHWGNDVSNRADKASGYAGVIGVSRSAAVTNPGRNERVECASGVGFTFMSDRPGFVEVRPVVDCTYQWFGDGHGLSYDAECRGGIDISAWLNGNLAAPVRRYEAFREGLGSGRGEGLAYVPDLTIRFPIVANALYVVPIGAWAVADHSATLGVSIAETVVEEKVMFAVIERWV